MGMICASLVFYFISRMPKVSSINDFALPSAILIYDRNNILLYSAYHDTFRVPINIDEVPQTLIDATISAEDKRFYKHFGFDPLAMTRALIHNARSSPIQGGSTITQQLAKNLYLNGERSLSRKIKEASITSKIEWTLDKKRILELYFNTTPYGGVTVGVEAASQRYFGKKTKDLNAKEAVFLASLPVGPTDLLEKNQSGMDARINYVLDRMVEDKKITREQKTKILRQDLHVLPQITYKKAPHAVDYVLAKLEEDYRDEIKSGKGLIVYTSIDLKLQNYIQQKILEQVSLYRANNITNAAVIVTRPKTGDVLSVVGSVNYYDEKYGQYNVVTSPRQLGSAMKIVTYAYALENGYQTNSVIKDEPVTFRDYPGYKPRNYDNKFHGNVTLTQAFANSFNIPALKIANELGADKIASLGVIMGVPELEFKDAPIPLSFVLGGVEVSLEHLTQAYSTVANDGVYIELSPIVQIADHQGNIIFSKTNDEGKRILSPETAESLYSILSDKSARATMFGYSPQFEFGEALIAIKTGTSNDNRDNTAFAFSPELVVGTWMGNNDNSSMWNVTSGYVGASSIMHDVTAQVLVESQDINPLTLNQN